MDLLHDITHEGRIFVGEKMQHKARTSGWQQPLPRQLNMPTVPRAFIQDFWTRKVLNGIINDFSFEEKQAIYFYFTMSSVGIDDVAYAAELSQNHTVSVLNLYSERLMSKLDFFKQIVPYEPDDLLPVVELLFSEPSN